MNFKFFKRSKSKNAPSLHFVPVDKWVPLRGEKSVLALACRNKIDINYSCDGNGTCGTCRVYITRGLELLPSRNEIETEWAVERGFANHERLACQIPPREGVEIEIPSEAKPSR